MPLKKLKLHVWAALRAVIMTLSPKEDGLETNIAIRC